MTHQSAVPMTPNGWTIRRFALIGLSGLVLFLSPGSLPAADILTGSRVIPAGQGIPIPKTLI